MAGYACQLCDGEETPVFLLTPLAGGETIAVGHNCAPTALCGVLAGYLGVKADRLYDQVRKFAERERQRVAAAEGQGSDGAAARRRPRRARESQQDQPPAEVTS